MKCLREKGMKSYLYEYLDANAATAVNVTLSALQMQ